MATVEANEHIEQLRRAIADNESNLAKMKTLLADLEKCRLASSVKHSTTQTGENSERSLSANSRQ
jgi:hypothetical protein